METKGANPQSIDKDVPETQSGNDATDASMSSELNQLDREHTLTEAEPAPKPADDLPAGRVETTPYVPPSNPTTTVLVASVCAVVSIVSLILIYFVTQSGLQSQSYESASVALNVASSFSWLAGIGLGVAGAFLLTRPRAIRRYPALRILLIIIGFVFGFLPGFILAVTIYYPLSRHACSLSGSKYC